MHLQSVLGVTSTLACTRRELIPEGPGVIAASSEKKNSVDLVTEYLS